MAAPTRRSRSARCPTPPPVVTVNAPPQAAAGSSVHISANAHDNIGVASVSISVNSGPPQVFPAPPYEVTYIIPIDAAGSIVGVVASAVDYAGNQGDATASINVVTTSEGDTTPPTVKLTAPLQVLVGKKLSLVADPHDNVGIASVALYVEGVNVATLTAPPYSVDVDLTPSQVPGTLLKLRAVATASPTFKDRTRRRRLSSRRRQPSKACSRARSTTIRRACRFQAQPSR